MTRNCLSCRYGYPMADGNGTWCGYAQTVIGNVLAGCSVYDRRVNAEAILPRVRDGRFC